MTGKLGYSSKKSSKRNIARLGFVLPIFQKLDSHMGYLTIIGLKDDAKHLEGNLGIGYRSFINPAWILGEYVFYDLRSTENNNLLQQVTVGIEAFSKNLEIRINGYIPTQKKYALSNYNCYRARYDSHMNTTQFNIKNKSVVEQGVAGFDIEVGGSHNKLSRLELFAAYYHFSGKNVDSTIGGRLRSNYNVLHWLVLEGEMNYDTNRKFVSYFGVRLGWTLGKNSANKPWSHVKMTQLPVRDIDVITAESNASTTLLNENLPGMQIMIAPGYDPLKGDKLEEEGTTIGADIESAFKKAAKRNQKIDDVRKCNVSADGVASIRDLTSKAEILALESLGNTSTAISSKFKQKIDVLASQIRSDVYQKAKEKADLALATEKRLREEAEKKAKEAEILKDEAELKAETYKNAVSDDKTVLTEKLLSEQTNKEKYKRNLNALEKDLANEKEKYEELKKQHKDEQSGTVQTKSELKSEQRIQELSDELANTKLQLTEASKSIPDWKKREIKKKAQKDKQNREYRQQQKRLRTARAKDTKQNNNGGNNAKQSVKAKLAAFLAGANKDPEPKKRDEIKIERTEKQKEDIKNTKARLKAKLKADVADNGKQAGTGGPNMDVLKKQQRERQIANGEKIDSKFGFENYFRDRKEDGSIDSPAIAMVFNSRVSEYIKENGIDAASQYVGSKDRVVKDKKVEEMFKNSFDKYLREMATKAGIKLGGKARKKKKLGRANKAGGGGLFGAINNGGFKLKKTKQNK